MKSEQGSVLNVLFQHGRRLIYKKEDMIIRGGDTPSGMYYILSGWVKVYSLCKNGEINIIMTLHSGDVFPIAWALNNPVSDINFAALSPTELMRIPKDEFIEAIQADGLLSRDVLQLLSGHFSTLANELDNLKYRSARERVVFRLICLAYRFGKENGGEIYIDTKIPNEYIARSTNMTRETASREISRLARKQLIHYKNGSLIINDLIKLKDEIDKHFNLDTLSID